MWHRKALGLMKVNVSSTPFSSFRVLETNKLPTSSSLCRLIVLLLEGALVRLPKMSLSAAWDTNLLVCFKVDMSAS